MTDGRPSGPAEDVRDGSPDAWVLDMPITPEVVAEMHKLLDEERRATIATLTAERDRLVAQNAALVDMVLECIEWADHRPDFTESEAYLSSKARDLIATNVAAGAAMRAELAALRRVRDAAVYVSPSGGHICRLCHAHGFTADRLQHESDCALAALPEGGR